MFNCVLQLTLNALEDGGLNDLYPFLAGFVQQWQLPKRFGRFQDLTQVFDVSRRRGNRHGGSFRAQVSEGLSLYPLLTFWVESMLIPRGVAVPACRALASFANVADCCQVAMRGECDHDRMRSSVHAFLAAFQAAFGLDEMIPKFHWMLHYAREMRLHGFLLSCFTHERKHKTVHRYATPTLQTRDYERVVIREVVTHHIRMLDNEDALDCQVGLVRPRLPSKRLRRILHELLGAGGHEVLVSNECRFCHFECCSIGDMVFVRNGAGILFLGEVWLHLQRHDQLLSIVSCYREVRRDAATRSAEWASTGNQQLVFAVDIVTVATWLRLPGDLIRTLMPADLL